MRNKSKYPRYQDYVISNGKLVGEFEEMYRDFVDPWEQSSLEQTALDKTIGLLLLQKYCHKRALEYGCGFGHFTAMLQQGLGTAVGIDISQTAIDKARSRYPDTAFHVGDITDTEFIIKFEPDSLILAEITWYILASLKDFKNKITKIAGGRGFLHLLTVYPESQQQYGKDYFTNLEEIREYWEDAINILEWGSTVRSDNGTIRTFFYGTIREKLLPCQDI